MVRRTMVGLVGVVVLGAWGCALPWPAAANGPAAVDAALAIVDGAVDVTPSDAGEPADASRTDATPSPDIAVTTDAGIDGGVDAGIDTGIDTGADTGVDTGFVAADVVHDAADVPSCMAPRSLCNGACVDLATDVTHCGGCGISCSTRFGTTAACVAGTCRTTCTGTYGDCDGIATNGCETNLATSRTNCGSCGNDCPGTATCAAGICMCFAGQALCGGSCVNLVTSTANCGACGNECPTRPGSTASCVAGACHSACNMPFADCDGVATNGCEVNLTTSTANCGACGTTCASGAACCGGACVGPCAAGTVQCGCACVPLGTTTNCGACGDRCGAAQLCVMGACM